MLDTQRNFIEYAQKLENLIAPFDLLNNKIEGQKHTLLEKLIGIRKEIENKELIIPIIGDFSSGKSSLINSFLSNNVLPTNITPETSLAAELRYSDKDYIEAISKENKVTSYTLSQFEEIKAKA